MLTEINSINSNQEIVESYVDGYRNGCSDTKIKIIDKFSTWLDAHIDDYLHQVDSDVWVDTHNLIVDLNKEMKKW